MASIRVLQSIAFSAAFRELAQQFDRDTGHCSVPVITGGLQVMARLRAGEVVDAVIMAAEMIDALASEGIVAPGSRVDLGISPIGVAVPAGAPAPDIGSGEAVRRALLAARAIAYSTGPSGVHLAALIAQMGIGDALAGRLIQVRGEPAGAAVARGEADLGFQQISELLPVTGIDIVGPLPDDIQKLTVFAIGLHARAPQPQAASALMAFLGSPAAAPVVRRKGMQPPG